ncbi:MAG TPA: L,D-transpeptidase, partial [Chloroflexota bacterium]|nr:L,D-transpeptidase [Chloroflexota bacterium]
MTRSTIVKIAAAAIIALLLSLSTARAHQVWDEAQAHAQLESARSAAGLALTDAAAAGVRTARLQPFVRQLTHLNAAAAPATSVIWGSRQGFYRAQTDGYRRLTVAVDRFLAHVTLRTRQQAVEALLALRHDMHRAGALDLATGVPWRAYGRAARQTRAARIPRAYRAATAIARRADQQLRTAIDARARAASGLVAQAQGSLAGVQQVAQADMSAVASQISLLGLFAPKSHLPASLRAAAAAVSSQRTAFTAAVKELVLRSLIQQSSGVFRRDVPGKLILVSTEDQMAYIYDGGSQVYSTPVTTGGPELPTDHGIFHIYEKISPFVFHSPWPPGSPFYYPPTPVEFWMPFDGAEGLHDASWRSNFGPGSNLAPTNLGDGNVILGT